jgi:hypothetical protein
MAFMGVTREGLSFSGPIRTISLSAIADRIICSECGSNFGMQYACYPHKTHLAVATVRHKEWEFPPVGVHIFVRSCPAWYSIPDDGIQRYDEFDPEFERKFPEVVNALRKAV